MINRIGRNWSMLVGFAGLLSLILSIGLIGIRQIHRFSAIVENLAQQQIPRQRILLEMQSCNSRYATGIRNYMFWQSSRFLGAAATADRLDLVRAASQRFEDYLNSLRVMPLSAAEKKWADKLHKDQSELVRLGDEIIRMSDELVSSGEQTTGALKQNLYRSLMDFEGRLYGIDAFLEDPLQKSTMDAIRLQLEAAHRTKTRSILFLSLALGIGLLLGVQMAVVIYRVSRRQARHREALCRAVIDVEEQERNHVSFQIHDEMGQDLSALKIYLGLLEKEVEPVAGDSAREKMAKTKLILETLMQKVHNICELLRPPALDEVGLVESIGALVVKNQELTGIRYHYDRPGESLRISAQSSLLLYRFAQEALTNIAKYAGASSVEVRLFQRGPSVVLTVTDNGVGFDYPRVVNRPSRRREDTLKLGLRGLRQRVDFLGGTLVVVTGRGRGTRLEVSLPLLET